MDWKGVVIHHSASGDVSARTIEQWHLDRGFAEIGYHFVIRRDGAIEPGRSWSRQGAHAATPAPSRNKTHLGICLTGHFGRTEPSHDQMESLVRLLRGLRDRWGITRLEAHHEECPGRFFPWHRLRALGFDTPGV